MQTRIWEQHEEKQEFYNDKRQTARHEENRKNMMWEHFRHGVLHKFQIIAQDCMLCRALCHAADKQMKLMLLPHHKAESNGGDAETSSVYGNILQCVRKFLSSDLILVLQAL
ncbi:hypothetical protein GOODEAATRI_026743 [Goodea atripinnis]|uniref:Uncharacterized protein n=1 Tax=Goodea atripinnis TaxID=208336 RepID=A0ABV0N6W2_9TELE